MITNPGMKDDFMKESIHYKSTSWSLWRCIVIVVYRVLFFLTFANTLITFIYFNYLRKLVYPLPSGDHSAPLVDHSLLGYVTLDQISCYRFLLTTMLVSIPAIMVIGAIFEYALKIPVLRGKAFYSEDISQGKEGAI